MSSKHEVVTRCHLFSVNDDADVVFIDEEGILKRQNFFTSCCCIHKDSIHGAIQIEILKT